MGEVSKPVLRIDHERTAERYVIRLVGEMDLANADEVRQALNAAIEGEAAAVIVDLSELEFVDSTGISALLSVQAASRRDSDRLAFRGAHAAVARTLHVTGVDEQLSFVD
jgi:anti-sigma B factor antagonist